MVRCLGLQSHLEQVAGAGFPENLPGHSLLSFPHMSGILALQLDPSSATLTLTVTYRYLPPPNSRALGG